MNIQNFETDQSLPVGLPPVDESVTPSNNAQGPAPCDAFDIEVAMEYTGGDPQILDELVGSMLEETPRLMERIRLAVAQSDQEAVRQEAHTLKGTVAMLGADDASNSAEALEIASHDGLENVGQLHDELQTRIDTLLNALEMHFSQYSRA